MSIFVTGVKGQLGYDILRIFKQNNYEDIIGIDKEHLDITNKSDVEKFFLDKKVDSIIHCAAYTAVDKAEEQVDMCMKVNVEGTENLLNIAKKNDAKFMYISTDYVFDGEKQAPYLVTDQTNPQSIYGKSKLLGEELTKNYKRHFIIRISWVFGINGNNFVKTMLRLGREQKEISVVNDQIGSPTYTFDLSNLIYEMIQTDKFGLYHATNEGSCSWFEFAQEIFQLSNLEVSVKGISTREYPTKAKRPINSILNKSELKANSFNRLPHWKDALSRYFNELGEN